jgi:hypothetical protein
MTRHPGIAGRGIIAVLLLSAALSSPRAAAAEPAVPAGRVVVFDIQAEGGLGPAVAQLPDLIGQVVSAHDGFPVVSSGELHRALQARQPSCSSSESCRIQIARELHADWILSESLARQDAGFALTLSLADAGGRRPAATATETMKRLKSLGLNARLCLDQLFHWKAGVATAGSASTATPPIPSSPLPVAPPPAVAAPAPAVGRPGTESPLSLAVLDMKVAGLPQETAASLTKVLRTVVKESDVAAVAAPDAATLKSGKINTGCAEAACLEEVGAALGAGRLITGTAAREGAISTVNLQLFDVHRGVVANRVTEQFEGDEEQLRRALRTAARRLLGLAAMERGTLAVTASQNAVDVFVDDQDAGKAPARVVNLLPGKHSVRVIAGGPADWHGDVYVEPLETTSIWAEVGSRSEPWYEKWWVWTVAGAVVAGGTTAGILLTRPQPMTGAGKVVYP